jgi:hypothetical protein
VSGVFISYRRGDSQALAGRLFDRLARRFGKEQVFRDIHAINPGTRFAEVIGERIGGCDALIALIGKGWLEAKDAEGRRRLDLPRDFVKAEIAAALEQDKLVIPALIDDTPMPPREALPAELAQLADRNALQISDSRFDFDAGRLIAAIKKVLTPQPAKAKAKPRRRAPSYSCFISYSTKDQEFAERLHADLQNKGVRCWFAPHDIQSGKKIHEQIDEAIRLYDRLLLILSESSIHSEWVETEISKARKRETREKRRMLFPVRLVDFETLRQWECFDADTGKDSAREIREYFIPDFSHWKDHDSYREAFQRLSKDLKAERATTT